MGRAPLSTFPGSALRAVRRACVSQSDITFVSPLDQSRLKGNPLTAKPKPKPPKSVKAKLYGAAGRPIAARDSVTGQVLPKAPAPQPVEGASQQVVKKPDTKRQHPKDAVLDTFHNLGGKRWLKNNAKKNPKDFIGLLSKAVSAEGGGNSGIVYVPVIIPVEQRETSLGVLEAVPVAVTVPEPDPFG